MERRLNMPRPRTIDSFRGEYAFLSNFHPSPLTWGGLLYPTVEHAYQAAKTDDPVQQDKILRTSTPGEAKKLGRSVDLRPDWDYVKLSIMHNLLRKKFFPGTDLARLLVDTGEAFLVEGNNWGDTYWGVSRGTGANWLGYLLMLVRSELWR